ncbi:hypothetical protein MBOU_10510 [Mycobacterium bourgelatii]|uniref:Uncharacterized protein n=1 Tax=Mycobacterium bourgelatii TaxID=1273442 RepID=A0A7I9YK55_MYCBU|nr:hypothetical protein MBOU_10510 [Mycobacterium bourgelatii]
MAEDAGAAVAPWQPTVTTGPAIAGLEHYADGRAAVAAPATDADQLSENPP